MDLVFDRIKLPQLLLRKLAFFNGKITVRQFLIDFLHRLLSANSVIRHLLDHSVRILSDVCTWFQRVRSLPGGL